MVFLRPSFGACATFSQFNFLCLYFSPLSGKTFNDIPVERNPLSAQCATLPEGESSYRRSAPLSPKGKAFYLGICVSLSPKGKAFLPSGKTFSLRLNQNGRKIFPLRLNQNEREDFQ